MLKIYKVLISMGVVASGLFAGEYGSTEKPIIDYIVKAKAAGVVATINDSGKYYNGIYLQLDSDYENDLLKNTNSILNNNKKLLDVRISHYNKIKDIKGKNDIEKDGYKILLLNEQNSVLNLEKDKLNIEDSIKNKKYKLDNKYVYDKYVDIGESVTMGQDLFRVQDISKAKVDFYVYVTEIAAIETGNYIISDKEYKLSNITKVSDDEHVFMYKVTFEKDVKLKDKIGLIIKLDI